MLGLTHMIRVRLGAPIGDEEVEGLIESPRFLLGPLIGREPAQMGKQRNDQNAYAQAALDMARAVGA